LQICECITYVVHLELQTCRAKRACMTTHQDADDAHNSTSSRVMGQTFKNIVIKNSLVILIVAKGQVTVAAAMTL
jgi:hypothetical protein